MPDTINPGVPVAKYGVLWRTKSLPTDDTPPGWTEYSGYWYDGIAIALDELECARANPRCEEARVFQAKITYTEPEENYNCTVRCESVEFLEELRENRTD